MKTYVFRVYGFVQGVGFRFFVKNLAESKHVTGNVRNLEDGSVEIFATMDESVLEEFFLSLRNGSAFAKVRDIKIKEIPLKEFSGFEIIR